MSTHSGSRVHESPHAFFFRGHASEIEFGDEIRSFAVRPDGSRPGPAYALFLYFSVDGLELQPFKEPPGTRQAAGGIPGPPNYFPEPASSRSSRATVR